MKRRIALILILMLVFSVAATGYGKETALFTTEMYEKVEKDAFTLHVKDAILEDGVLYALYHNRLYRYEFKEEKPRLLHKIFAYEERKSSYYTDTYEEAQKAIGEKADDLVHYLFFWEDYLYGLNKFTYHAMAFDPNTGKRVKEKDLHLPNWALMGEESYSVKNTIDGVIGNKLFVRHMDYEKYEEGNQIYSFDLVTGQRQSYKLQNAKILLPYKDNCFLAVVFDENRFFSEEGQEALYPQLMFFNPEEETTENLFSIEAYQPAGITYSEKEDCIYYNFQGEVLKVTMDGTQSVVGYIENPYSEMEQRAWSIEGNKYILWKEWVGIYATDIQQELSEKAALTIHGDWRHIDKPKSFEEKYPDMPVINLEFNTHQFTSWQDLTLAVKNKTTDADIFYLLPNDIDVGKIIEEEAAYPLSGSALIKEKTEDMYPAFKEYFQKNGDIYAVPYMAKIVPNIYLVPGSWQRLGLRDKQPATVVELLDFVYEWQEKLQVKHPDYYLLAGQMMTKSFLINYVLEEYQQYYEKNQLPITFDTPLFRQLMAKLKKIDLPLTERASDNFDDPNPDNALFASYGEEIFAGDILPVIEALYLPLDEDHGPTVKPFLQVAIVNAASSQKEAAVAYLEGMMEEYNNMQKVTLFRSFNQPIKNEDYEERIDYFTKSLAKSKEELRTAKDEEEVEVLINAIAYFEDQLTQKEEYYWEISQEKLDFYQDLLPYLFVSTAHNDVEGLEDKLIRAIDLMKGYMLDKVPINELIEGLEAAAGNAG